MQQLLLSSHRLEAQKVLNTGSINVFEQLKKNANPAISIPSDVPKGDLILEWKEVVTPDTTAGLKDLVGKKLATYKFQYIGQFIYDGAVVEPVGEQFVAGLDTQVIHNQTLPSQGWVNCTWLVDFMLSSKDGKNEKLVWRKEEDYLVFSMSTEAIDHTSAEQQKIAFSTDFSQLKWVHKVLFAKK